jgi:hypothetical protein
MGPPIATDLPTVPQFEGRKRRVLRAVLGGIAPCVRGSQLFGVASSDISKHLFH